MNIKNRRAAGFRIFTVFQVSLAALAVTSFSGIREATASEFESESRKGHGYFGLSYQYISVDGFQTTNGKVPIGKVETHSFNLEVEYYFTDKFSILGGVPYVTKRYKGGGPHNPLALDPPRPEVENVDTGDWNSDFQDFFLALRYAALEGPFLVEPFISYGVPSQDYPFFGHAAVGQNLNKFEVGSSFGWFPGLSNAYYRWDIGYVFVEKTLGNSIDHWRINGEFGYHFSARLTGRVFALLKKGKGLEFPDDFPPPRTSEMWYQHDRMVKHNYLNAGIGLDWAINEKYTLSSNFMVQPWREQVHTMEYAISLGLFRSF